MRLKLKRLFKSMLTILLIALGMVSQASPGFADTPIRSNQPAKKNIKVQKPRKKPPMPPNKVAPKQSASEQDASESKSNFKTVEFNCKEEKETGPDTSPQSPPLIIDDPGTPGCNNWEINFTFDIDISPGEKHLESPLLDINYGIGDNLQLKFEIPELIDKTDEASTTALGDPKMGIKYLFYQNEATELEVAFYPQIEIARAKEESGYEINLPILMTKKVGQTKRGDIIMAVNATYNIANPKVAKNSVSLAAGVGFPFTRKIAIMTELALDQALEGFEEEKPEQILVANVGLKGPITATLSPYVSLGASLVSSDGKQHIFALTGLQWTP